MRAALQKDQANICPLCGGKLGGAKGKKPALDHDHITGVIRDVLCLNCNGMEGKIHNLARRGLKGNATQFLENMLAYWKKHQEEPRQYLHPTHKTAAEKRARTNKLARQRRAKAKAAG